jgi:hypothetical protein
MKTKTLKRKLTLNKKTIVTLNDGYMMGKVVGGGLQFEDKKTQDISCFLPHTDCADCTLATCVTCNTCGTCATACSVCLTFCGPGGAQC